MCLCVCVFMSVIVCACVLYFMVVSVTLGFMRFAFIR